MKQPTKKETKQMVLNFIAKEANERFALIEHFKWVIKQIEEGEELHFGVRPKEFYEFTIRTREPEVHFLHMLHKYCEENLK